MNIYIYSLQEGLLKEKLEVDIVFSIPYESVPDTMHTEKS